LSRSRGGVRCDSIAPGEERSPYMSLFSDLGGTNNEPMLEALKKAKEWESLVRSAADEVAGSDEDCDLYDTCRTVVLRLLESGKYEFPANVEKDLINETIEALLGY